MDRDIEGFKEIDAQKTLDMRVERKSMTEDREIFDAFTQAVETSQSHLRYHNRSICRKDSPSLPAGSWIITDLLEPVPGEHALIGACVSHEPDHLNITLAFDRKP